jgi:hypothetical protein
MRILFTVSTIKKQAKATSDLMSTIIQTLDKLDSIIAPNEHLSSPELKEKFPRLGKLRVRRNSIQSLKSPV